MIECWYVKYIFNCAQNSINSWVSKYKVDDNIKFAVKIKTAFVQTSEQDIFFLIRFMNVKLLFSADQAFKKKLFNQRKNTISFPKHHLLVL